MTGYGKAQTEAQTQQLVAEVKTLNSKFLELSLRLPKPYSDFEMEIRNLVGKELVRGKVNLNLEVQQHNGAANTVAYNQQLFNHYYNELSQLAAGVNAPTNDLFRLALQQPDVTTAPVKEVKDDEWSLVRDTILEALKQCTVFRTREGEALRQKLHGYAAEIGRILSEIEKQDSQRVDNIRARLEARLEELSKSEKLDQNRLEQEMFFYIEKLDISEEKVRLRTHLNYFEQILDAPQSNGKKLGFLAQEIGREINTIGSKANDASVQQLVVQMKEELEKIKEQSLNVL